MSEERLFPQATIVGRAIAKKVFTERLEASARMKGLFARGVERITWLAKLAPSTLNVADGRSVHEIAVFAVETREREDGGEIFDFIDTWMPRHTLFVIRSEGREALLVNYKEKAAGGTGKQYCTVRTYRTGWREAGTLAVPLTGLTMDTIYENIVRHVAGDEIAAHTTDLRADIEQSERIRALRKQISALKVKEAAERQPTKKFELHQQIAELKKDLDESTDGRPTGTPRQGQQRTETEER